MSSSKYSPIKRLQTSNKITSQAKQKTPSQNSGPKPQIASLSIPREFPDSSFHKEETIQKLSLQYYETLFPKYQQQIVSLKAEVFRINNQHKKETEVYVAEVNALKQQNSILEKQLQGQKKLLEEYQAVMDENQHMERFKRQFEVKMFQYEKKIKDLQKMYDSTHEVSLELIKENENHKKEHEINAHKYRVLLQDYQELRSRHQKIEDIHRASIRELERSLQEVTLENTLYRKDKQIQQLLSYEHKLQAKNYQSTTMLGSFRESGGSQESQNEHYRRHLQYFKQTNQLLSAKNGQLERKIDELESRNTEMQEIILKI